MKKFLLSRENLYGAYIIIGILSAVVFFTIYGVRILNPTYTDWLLCEQEDLAQHYLGWTAYRNSGWHFPPGTTDALSYPHLSSIIFTDSIPLMAVFFKILSPILPQDFQYFGFWGLLCFILQGILTLRIIKNYTNDMVSAILTSILFLFAPILLFRMFIHTALASQWIILLGLEPIFAQAKYENNKKIYIVAALMAMLSSSVHIYFVLMSGIILAGICLADIITHRRFLRSFLLIVEYLCIAVLIVWLLGGFTGDNHATAGGLGAYSLNLNAFINPLNDWSCFFKSLPLTYPDAQQEGFAWLGAGIIFMLPFSAILFLGCGRTSQIYRKYAVKTLLPLCIVAGIAILLALSPTVTIGNRVLFTIKLPDPISGVWGIFRCTGRIAWISVYVLMLCTCVAAYKLLNKKTFILLMLFSLSMQIYDSHEFIETTSIRYNSPRVYDSLESSAVWDIAAKGEISHIVYCSPREGNALYKLTNWALKHNKTMNTFYFARSNDLIDVSTKESLNNPSTDELFVFAADDFYVCMNYKLHYYAADGMIVGYVDKIEELDEVLNGYMPFYSFREQNHCVTAFVDSLFQKLLGRAGEDEELEKWCRMILQRELTMENAVYSFINSPEFQSCRYTDAEFIEMLYDALLNRECAPSELSSWLEEINHGLSREEIVQKFIKSKEFLTRMEEGGVMRSWITAKK